MTLNVGGIATRYGMDSPGVESQWQATFTATVQTDPGAHPVSGTMGTGILFWGVKQSGPGANKSTAFRAEVNGRVELYLYPRLGLHGLFWGKFYPLLISVWSGHCDYSPRAPENPGTPLDGTKKYVTSYAKYY